MTDRKSTFVMFRVGSRLDGLGGMHAKYGDGMKEVPSFGFGRLLVGCLTHGNFQKLLSVGRTPVSLSHLPYLCLFISMLVLWPNQNVLPHQNMLYIIIQLPFPAPGRSS